MRKTITTGAFLIATLWVCAGSGGASPQATTTVNYTVTPIASSTVITTDAGSLAVDNGVFTVKAANGTVLAGAELSFRVDDFTFPINADISGPTATLTPQLDREHATYAPITLPYETQAPWKTEYEREQAAWNRLSTTLAMGASIGTAVGAIGGAAVGCVLGGIAGATVASAAIIGLFGAFIPAAAVGCIGGIMALGTLGTIAGTLLVTAPIAIMAAVQYFTTINQPAPKAAPAPAPSK